MNLRGNIKSIKIFQFDAVEKNRKIEKEKVDNSGNSVSVDTQLEFNETGMITEHRQYVSDELTNKFIYEYDDQLNILTKDYYDNSGNLLAESKFENLHNSKGELVEEKEFMSGKNLDRNWIHKFFKDKNEIKKIEYAGGESYKILEYSYDKEGRVIEELWKSSDGSIYIKTLTEYKNGNISLVSLLDSKDSIFSKSEYEYLNFDNEKNWTRLLITENSIPETIIEAKIEYYK